MSISQAARILELRLNQLENGGQISQYKQLIVNTFEEEYQKCMKVTQQKCEELQNENKKLRQDLIYMKDIGSKYQKELIDLREQNENLKKLKVIPNQVDYTYNVERDTLISIIENLTRERDSLQRRNDILQNTSTTRDIAQIQSQENMYLIQQNHQLNEELQHYKELYSRKNEIFIDNPETLLLLEQERKEKEDMRKSLRDLRGILENNYKVPNIERLNYDLDQKDQEILRLNKRIRELEKGGKEISQLTQNLIKELKILKNENNKLNILQNASDHNNNNLPQQNSKNPQKIKKLQQENEELKNQLLQQQQQQQQENIIQYNVTGGNREQAGAPIPNENPEEVNNQDIKLSILDLQSQLNLLKKQREELRGLIKNELSQFKEKLHQVQLELFDKYDQLQQKAEQPEVISTTPNDENKNKKTIRQQNEKLNVLQAETKKLKKDKEQFDQKQKQLLDQKELQIKSLKTQLVDQMKQIDKLNKLTRQQETENKDLLMQNNNLKTHLQQQQQQQQQQQLYSTDSDQVIIGNGINSQQNEKSRPGEFAAPPLAPGPPTNTNNNQQEYSGDIQQQIQQNEKLQIELNMWKQAYELLEESLNKKVSQDQIKQIANQPNSNEFQQLKNRKYLLENELSRLEDLYKLTKSELDQERLRTVQLEIVYEQKIKALEEENSYLDQLKKQERAKLYDQQKDEKLTYYMAETKRLQDIINSQKQNLEQFQATKKDHEQFLVEKNSEKLQNYQQSLNAQYLEQLKQIENDYQNQIHTLKNDVQILQKKLIDTGFKLTLTGLELERKSLNDHILYNKPTLHGINSLNFNPLPETETHTNVSSLEKSKQILQRDINEQIAQNAPPQDVLKLLNRYRILFQPDGWLDLTEKRYNQFKQKTN